MIRGHNSTIIRREKLCRSCGKPCYPFSKGRCQSCSAREDTMKRMEKVVEKEAQGAGLSELIKEADAVVSLYVRLSNADEYGNCQCYTCPTNLPYQQMQAGHYISRANLLLRWDVIRNIRVQCSGCNCVKHGNLAVFAQNLEKERPGLPDILIEESEIVYKISRDEIKQIIAEYTPKVRELKKKLVLPD